MRLELKSGLVASHDVRSGNGEGLIWFQCLINLSLAYHTSPLTYSSGTHTGQRTVHSAVIVFSTVNLGAL